MQQLFYYSKYQIALETQAQGTTTQTFRINDIIILLYKIILFYY